ncbi:endolytic transglycosylase MltG [sulfur-oxidizing endosymbiont of Gigantopelta aegis]|uniref:endolytic transglycosylase MltG n=1 Tax=sulfur-oxidizing endosymbiont of Gigantopelta aegis TaxID=2794934 RepID=UPI0018DDFAD2|nr:endolytic transglycosylase MltG [sulfur-oxidizing endosymbiont of Gigantopelta aegis]
MIKKLLILLLFLAVIGTAVAAWFWNDYSLSLSKPIAISKHQSESLFTVNKGDRVKNIAENLRQKDIIQQPEYFRIYARLSHKAEKIKAGEYVLKSGMTVVDVIDLFVLGKVNQYALTIVEGWTFKETIARIRQDSNLVKTAEFAQALNSKTEAALANKLGSESMRLEGLIYPDTYKFPKGTTDFQFLKRAYDNMQAVLADEWVKREKKTPLKSAYEALILASIVEKESGVSSERGKIAGVFIRRMNKKMRLQSDPTIIYGMGDSYKGNIRRRDINKKTAYNTYQIKRLPPTPIAIPGREAIHAVLHPDKGKYLYFVADGSGGHKFSKTLKEHNRAVRKYILKKK